MLATYPTFTFSGTSAPGTAFGAGDQTVVGVSQVDNATLTANCHSGGLKQLIFGLGDFKTT